MSPARRALGRLLIACALATGACATVPGLDYAAYRERSPRSILVLPPRNESNIVGAPYVYLSTISRPLAECGYYVFPVAVIDAFMKENGLPAPEEMHGVSREKLREVIGPDAVLYVTIEDWGQKYLVLDSVTVVKARVELVDVDSGQVLWHGTQHASVSSTPGGSNLIVKLIATAVVQMLKHTFDHSYWVSRMANHAMAADSSRGLLLGPYRPREESDRCPRLELPEEPEGGPRRGAGSAGMWPADQE